MFEVLFLNILFPQFFLIPLSNFDNQNVLTLPFKISFKHSTRFNLKKYSHQSKFGRVALLKIIEKYFKQLFQIKRIFTFLPKFI